MLSVLGENDTHDSSNHAQANQVHNFSCSLFDKTMNTNMEIFAIKASWHNKLGVSGVQLINCTFQ